MKIGIVSDSHGQVKRLRRGIEMLTRRGAEAIVHCGDIGKVECLAVLAESGLPCYAVTGNMDRNVERLRDHARDHHVHLESETVVIPIGRGRYLAVTHGNKPEVLAGLITGGRFDYVCHGHTHLKRDENFGKVRVINPGALCHTDPFTVALLDTDSDTLKHIEVK
ncbi:hypothetical protein LCGC14_1610880 [marine sediment metagenome]|uniref:Calcineurin-like phosphoesterase domain-containing protein n=1 Tax=marine sediment metagenome TaxID=412755 RepID=A0A0F9KP24_9ZZZZ